MAVAQTNGWVEIPLAEYNRLKMFERKLLKLETAGVDNWEGYDEAMQEDE